MTRGTAPTLNSNHQFEIRSLRPGWNMIGNPFLGAVNASDLQVQPTDASGQAQGPPLTLADADTAGYARQVLYTYPAGATAYQTVAAPSATSSLGHPADQNSVQPYAGYWVRIYQPCTLLIPAPAQ